MKTSPTKQKVVDAASSLFFQKGFHGTSVRDIAEKAAVNVSLISYYFKGKQGLLEHAVTNYYETYLALLEETILETESLSSLEQLKKLVFSIIQYKQSNHQFSCFIHRELSLDSVFVREMAVTYLAKENHFISKTFFEAIKDNKDRSVDRHLLLMQLKGMMVTPYVLQHEWRNQVVTVDDYSNNLFVKRYTKTIHDWLDFIVHQKTISFI